MFEAHGYMADFIYLFIYVFPEMMDHLICDLTADPHSLGSSAL